MFFRQKLTEFQAGRTVSKCVLILVSCIYVETVLSRTFIIAGQQDPTFIECDKSSAGLYLFNESDVESKRDLLILEHPPPHANSKNIHSTIEHNRIRFENEDFCTASQLNNKNYGDVGKALPRINTSYFSELDCYAKDFSLTENASYSSLPLHQLIDNLTNVD